MIHIKKFIDKIALMEARQGRDVVLPLSDARALRDEITRLLLDQKENTSQQPEVIEVVMKGGKF